MELAQKLLSETWGVTVRLEDPTPLARKGRSHVDRYRIDCSGGSGLPETVVVKQVVTQLYEKYMPDAAGGPAGRLFNDWAGLEFLRECFSDSTDMPIPRLIAGDRTNGLIVMHDLGARKGLDDCLLGDDSTAAIDYISGFYTELGRIHATTCGKQDRYNALRNLLGPQEALSREERFARYRENLVKGLARLELQLSDRAQVELDQMLAACFGDGPFKVYSHNDACPDNVLCFNRRTTLLDFEHSGMAGVAVDMRSARAIWPTCWCANRVPVSLLTALESVYRSELVKGCSAAQDDFLFDQQLVAGCGEAAIRALGQEWLYKWCIPKASRLGDEIATQQVLARLDAFADISEERGQFPVLGAIVRASGRAIRSELPREFRELPVYFALR